VENVMLGLVALACPVGMGLMMWFMARGTRKGGTADSEAPGSLDELRAEHRRLGAEIERLEDDSTRSSFVETPR
jgi:hypothetical protein